MARPCPVCQGQCGVEWVRSVDMVSQNTVCDYVSCVYIAILNEHRVACIIRCCMYIYTYYLAKGEEFVNYSCTLLDSTTNVSMYVVTLASNNISDSLTK